MLNSHAYTRYRFSFWNTTNSVRVQTEEIYTWTKTIHTFTQYPSSTRSHHTQHSIATTQPARINTKNREKKKKRRNNKNEYEMKKKKKWREKKNNGQHTTFVVNVQQVITRNALNCERRVNNTSSRSAIHFGAFAFHLVRLFTSYGSFLDC